MFFLLFVYIFASSMAAYFPQSRALWNLEVIAQCELGYNALAYNNYGCWCGVGGSYKPMDGIDKCCMKHDKCYETAVKTKVCSGVAWEYVDDYSWKCKKGKAQCKAGQGGCSSALCACDKAVVDCWKRFPRPPKKMRCSGRDYRASSGTSLFSSQ